MGRRRSVRPRDGSFTAFQQWYFARKFLKELKDIATNNKDEKFKAS